MIDFEPKHSTSDQSPLGEVVVARVSFAASSARSYCRLGSLNLPFKSSCQGSAFGLHFSPDSDWVDAPGSATGAFQTRGL